jgi:glycosyltransferase involved in cell wall biosynthesis
MIVSVVIPVYNVLPYLERCLKSVLNQTYKDMEIILIDDGSTDGSGILCDKLAKQDARIRVIHQKNIGLSGARNKGIQSAIGEYVVFIDSDDEWLIPDGLEKILSDETKHTDLIVFKSVDYWKNGRRTFTKDFNLKKLSCQPDAQAVFNHLILTQRFEVSACFLLIRRQLLIDNEIYFPIGLISEDVYWSLHLWQHVHTVTFLNLDFYGYYHRVDSLSRTASIQAYYSYDKIFSYWKEQCNSGCVNAMSIRYYLANLWITRGYKYYQLEDAYKPAALNFLYQHADVLKYTATPKSKRVAILVKLLGIKNSACVLGLYWRLRTWYEGHIV